MAKYVCQVCGFIYDEEKRNPVVLWNQLPDDWVCPVCKASRSAFKKLESQTHQAIERKAIVHDWTALEISLLLSNLEKGCEKQYLTHEQELFHQLADYYQHLDDEYVIQSFEDMQLFIDEDLNQNYPLAHKDSDDWHDRGAKRALVWSEKSTNMIASILARYQQEQTNITNDTKVFVCEICGFIAIGDEAPEICPVCKVPRLKIHEVKRGLVL